MKLENIYEELLSVGDCPEKFDALAKKFIDEYIAGLKEDQHIKMRQFQWRIDGELRKYKDPVARYNRMVELFWSGVNQLNDTISTSK